MANEENAAYMWNFFKSKTLPNGQHLSDAQIAGILGNSELESAGFEPSADSGNGFYGLFQWGGSRQENLRAYAGGKLNDLFTQLEFAWDEWTNGGYESQQFMRAMNEGDGTPEDYARLFREYVERPSANDSSERQALARKRFNMYNGQQAVVSNSGFTGSAMESIFAPAAQQMGGGYFDENQDPERAFYGSTNSNMGYLEGLLTNFIDSELDAGGILNTAINMWGLAAHTTGAPQPLTQDDEKLIKTALAGDKDAQEFVMLFANDSEHAKWLVQQKLEEKQRKARLEEWKDGNHNVIARLGMGAAGAAGYILDPLNLLPTVSAFSKVRLATRLGDGLLNVAKADRIAQLSAGEMRNALLNTARAENVLSDSSSSLIRYGNVTRMGEREELRLLQGAKRTTQLEGTETPLRLSSATNDKNVARLTESIAKHETPYMRFSNGAHVDWDIPKPFETNNPPTTYRGGMPKQTWVGDTSATILSSNALDARNTENIDVAKAERALTDILRKSRPRSKMKWAGWGSTQFEHLGLNRGKNTPATIDTALKTISKQTGLSTNVINEAFGNALTDIRWRARPHKMKWVGWGSTELEHPALSEGITQLPHRTYTTETLTKELATLTHRDLVTVTENALMHLQQNLPATIHSPSSKTFKDVQEIQKDTQNIAWSDIMSHAIDVGLNAAGTEILNRQLVEANTGREQDYGTTAAVAFILGSVLGGLGRAWSNNHITNTIKAKADSAESRVYSDVAGIPSPIKKMKAPTQQEAERMIKMMREAHDSTIQETLVADSKFLRNPKFRKKFANYTITTTTFDRANDMLKKASGMELPKSAKAFYVPSIKGLVLLGDKIKAGETDKILAHEMTHGTIKELLGEKAYTTLMKDIGEQRKTKGNDFYVASKRYGTTDPEELLAYVLQDDKLHIPKATMSKKIRGALNKALGREGVSYKFDDKTLEELLTYSAKEHQHLQETGEHSNPIEVAKEDEETGEFVPFADIQFSKESVGNAENFAQFGTSETPVQDITQADLKIRPLKWLGKKLENGYIGEAMESISPTFRKVFSHLFEDPRGRGMYKSDTAIPAETNMLRIMHRLNTYLYDQLAPLETQWMGKLTINKGAADKQWWQMICNAFNAKNAGHSSTVIKDVPEEVNKAVEVLEKFFKEEEEIGRKSAEDVGSSADNMIEQDWYSVDHEMPRISNDELKAKFIRENYVHSQEKTALEQAKEDIKEYILKAAKRRGDPKDPLRQNSIEGQILRTKKMQNAKADRWNEAHKGDKNFKAKEKVDEVVSDEEIQKYLDDHVDDTVEAWLGDHTFDPAIIKRTEALGRVPWFNRRIPVDTSYVMRLKNSKKEFSFDNNLRSYNYNEYFRRRIRRYAGEIAVKNEFKSAYGYEKAVAQIKTELNRAVEDGKIDATERDSQLRNFERGVAELRGHAQADDIATGKAQVLGRIARNWAYFKNGANMGLNQLAEVAGSVTYGGVSQMFSWFKPIQQLVDAVRLGNKTSKTLDELEYEQFGTSMEYQLFPHTYQDSVTRNALTRDTILNNGLITASETTQRLSKITSLLNMLPKTTEWMTRAMRKQTIIDSLRWAKGENVGLLRNPFSKAKLKAARISETEAKQIKESLRAYSVYDEHDNLINFNVDAWKKADMNSYLKWYNMIMLQSERAITPAYRLGNSNLFKNNHGIVPQLLMQFKDYSLRSLNAQTLRTLTARDLDDFLFAGMSVITNTAVYLGRKKLEIALLYATGQTAAAQLKEKNSFSDDNIKRAVATRSTVIGTPLSFANDAYEIATGAESVRTTVQRKAASKTGKDRMAGDMAKDAVNQIPAIQSVIDPLTAGAYAVGRMVDGNMKSKDFTNLMQLIPLPNWIPFIPLQTYISNKK